MLTLQNNTTVEAVNLQENGLGAEGGIYFLHMLKSNNYIADVVRVFIQAYFSSWTNTCLYVKTLRVC